VDLRLQLHSSVGYHRAAGPHDVGYKVVEKYTDSTIILEHLPRLQHHYQTIGDRGLREVRPVSSSTAAGVHEGVSFAPLKQGLDRRADLDSPHKPSLVLDASPWESGGLVAEKQLLL